MSPELSIILYGTIAGLSTILGVFLVILQERLVLKYSHYINSLAAGLILGVAFFHLFSESLELSENALIFIFIGFLLFYLMENVMVIHSGAEIHFKEKKNFKHSKGIVMFFGLFSHSLIDGIIIGIGFKIDPKVGLLTSLGVISHELPEGATTFVLLVDSIKRKMALKLSILVALATPVGSLISLIFISALSEATKGLLLAMAGGSFLYIGASDLIPETHGAKGLKNAGFLIFGIIVVFIMSRMLML